MSNFEADFVVRGIGGDPWIDLAIRLGTAVEHGVVRAFPASAAVAEIVARPTGDADARSVRRQMFAKSTAGKGSPASSPIALLLLVGIDRGTGGALAPIFPGDI
jgi:hypothetical protein